MSIPAGWVSVADSARWVRLAPDVLKPVTRVEGGKQQYRVALADVDKWMRSQPSAREAMRGVA